MNRLVGKLHSAGAGRGRPCKEKMQQDTNDGSSLNFVSKHPLGNDLAGLGSRKQISPKLVRAANKHL